METTRSLASGWSGGLPGTGRPSASFSSASGRLFAEEVERAREEEAGTGLAQERRAALADSRRAARRAGFGAEPRAEEPASVEPSAPEMTLPASPPPQPAPSPAPSAEEPFTSAPAAGPAATPANAAGATAEHASPPEAAPLTSSVQPAVPVVPVQPPFASERVVAALHSLPPVEPVAPPASIGSRASAPRAGATTTAEPAPGAETAARADEILRQIELHVSPSVKRVTLELEPVELGRLSIQLALRAGKLAAIVRGERPETLALLEQRAPELARLLAARGLATDELRFELGFRAPAGARRARTSSTLPRTPAGAAGGAPGSVDTLA